MKNKFLFLFAFLIAVPLVSALQVGLEGEIGLDLSPTTLTGRNITYINQTNVTNINQFDQSLNTTDNVTFDSVHLNANGWNDVFFSSYSNGIPSYNSTMSMYWLSGSPFAHDRLTLETYATSFDINSDNTYVSGDFSVGGDFEPSSVLTPLIYYDQLGDVISSDTFSYSLMFTGR